MYQEARSLSSVDKVWLVQSLSVRRHHQEKKSLGEEKVKAIFEINHF
jgi:hypothetical protein